MNYSACMHESAHYSQQMTRTAWYMYVLAASIFVLSKTVHAGSSEM